MKVQKKDADRLSSIISTALLGGVDSMVFRSGSGGIASGLNADRTCAIITQNTPDFGQELGLTRLGAFKNRINLMLGCEDLAIDAKEHERGEISQLDFSARKMKMSYRASSHKMIKAPSRIDDIEVAKASIKMDQWQTIVQAIKAMGAKQVCLVVRDNGELAFEAVDEATSDRFSITVDMPLEILEGDFETAVHYIPSDLLIQIARSACPPLDANQILTFTIASGGTIKMIVNECEMYIFAQINSDD